MMNNYNNIPCKSYIFDEFRKKKESLEIKLNKKMSDSAFIALLLDNQNNFIIVKKQKKRSTLDTFIKI